MPDSPRTIAALFRRSLAVPGFETCTAADVRRLHPVARHVLLRAIRAVTDPEDADEAGSGDMTEADRIHGLHELGYEFPAIYGLLPREIELVSEGAKRAADRRESGSGGSASVESAEGTQMRGGPAESVNQIDFVDETGGALT